MAIKKLQNDCTTQEQSKQLLELGIPADSANMHYHQECVRIEYGKEEFEYFLRYGKPDTSKYSTDIPCWSVGRLIEIYVYLTSHEYISLIFKKTFTPMDKILDKLEKGITNGILDLSKLEE